MSRLMEGTSSKQAQRSRRSAGADQNRITNHARAWRWKQPRDGLSQRFAENNNNILVGIYTTLQNKATII